MLQINNRIVEGIAMLLSTRNHHYITFFIWLSCFIFACNTYANHNTTQQGKPFNHIVFFGDSLTDNGNFYNSNFGFVPQSPPYFKGRFSNGLVWAEYIADHYTQSPITTENYAMAGLTATLHDAANTRSPFTLTGSVNNYLVHSPLFGDKSTTLYIIWVGANDYLWGEPNVDKLTTEVISAIKYNIDYLTIFGANHFLIINLPDLSLTPAGISSPLRDNLHALTTMHNQKLQALVTEMQNSYKQINVHLFDSNAVISELSNLDEFNKKYQSHLTNTMTACWLGGYIGDSTPTSLNKEVLQQQLTAHIRGKMQSNRFDTQRFTNIIANRPDLRIAYLVSRAMQEKLTPCANPDDYVFWDQIHPTVIMHKILAASIIPFIDQNYMVQR